MTLKIDRDHTRAVLDCTLQPRGITDFLYWLGSNEAARSTLDEVNIEHNGRRYPHNEDADINICQIYHILELLPAVDTFHIHGMVLVPCNLNGHGRGIYHTPRPPSPQLTSLHLTSIAIRYPFDVDPLRLTTIGPAVQSLYMEDWWALPHSRRVSPIQMALRHPQAELGPALPLERSLNIFEVTFPSRVNRKRFGSGEGSEWYEFPQRLPSQRGTRNLTLKDIDKMDIPTVVSIIAEDVATLETLDLGFVPGLQKFPRTEWANLSLAGSTRLRNVTLRLAIRRVVRPEPPYFVLLGFVSDIVVRLPPGLEQLTFDIVFHDNGTSAIETSAGCVPWRQIDRHLEDRQSTAAVVVRSFSAHMLPPGPVSEIVKKTVTCRMVYTVRNERLRFM